MSEDFLPFSRPSISPEAINEVVECLKSGWITTGPRTKRFEDDLKQYLGAPQVLALTSATAGLHLALLALDLKPGRRGYHHAAHVRRHAQRHRARRAPNRCWWTWTRAPLIWT